MVEHQAGKNPIEGRILIWQRVRKSFINQSSVSPSTALAVLSFLRSPESLPRSNAVSRLRPFSPFRWWRSCIYRAQGESSEWPDPEAQRGVPANWATAWLARVWRLHPNDSLAAWRYRPLT